MLPREHGGVVDPRLRVYGTENIRVVDLSIVPLNVGAHNQCMSDMPYMPFRSRSKDPIATAYAIGERAADIIKADLKN